MRATDGHWLTAWVLDLPSLAMLAGISAIYLRGAALRTTTVGVQPSPSALERPPDPQTSSMLIGHVAGPQTLAVQRRRTVTFMAGIAVVALGEMSPVAVFSQDLFWVHMVQHLMIMVVAAPLLAAGAPVSTVRFALTPRARRLLARLSRQAGRWRRAVGAPPPLALATVVHAATLWAWHMPALYDAAVASPALHLVEHATMLGSAVWFWSQVWATARRHRAAQAQATLCLAATIMQGGVLGALLVFAGRPLYSVYSGASGFTALEDQQLAGGLMWVPPAFVYAFVAAQRFVGWMHAAERDARRRDAYASADIPIDGP